MRSDSFFIVLLFVFFAFGGVLRADEAGSPYTGGMKSRLFNHDKTDPPEPSLFNKQENDEDPYISRLKELDRVWKTYQVMAAGGAENMKSHDSSGSAQSGATSGMKKEIMQDEGVSSVSSGSQIAPVPTTGLGGILNQYNQGKTDKGKMRTMRVSPQE